MPLNILDRTIVNVAVIDDQPLVRKSYGYTIQNVGLDPWLQEGPLPDSIDEASSSIAQGATAAVCDYKLSGRAYAKFKGAELAADLYKKRLPVLLCTQYVHAEVYQFTPFRRWIPVILAPRDVNEETLIRGLRDCIAELDGEIRVERRPWRTMIHFLSEDEDSPGVYFAEIPGWSVDQVIKIRLSSLPPGIRRSVKPDYRCFAKVNLGAESDIDLFVYDWELP
jgi:hypothetical protein